MNSYKGITFPKGFKTSFGDFKKNFGSHKIFLDVPHKDKEAKMQKAYDVLTGKTKTPEVKTKDFKNGNSDKSAKQSKENKSE